MTTLDINPAPPSLPHPRATDQASRLRALVEAARSRDGTASKAPTAARRTAPIIAVTSGKGGVGKTTLCVNLCIALANSGVRATLVDADLGMANADLVCGLKPTRRLERVVGLAGAGGVGGPVPSPHDVGRIARSTLRDIAVQAPGGFRLVPGSVGIAHMAGLDPAERAIIIDALAELDRDSDVLMVDTGAGVSPGVMSFVRAADLALVVVTPEPTSIADAYALIKCLLRGPGAPQASLTPQIGLVVNQAADAAEGSAVYARIAAVAERFLGMRPAMLGCIPADPGVPRAVRARRPFLLDQSRTGAALAVTDLAATLSRRLKLRAAKPPVERAALGRLISAWFSRSGSSARADYAGTTKEST